MLKPLTAVLLFAFVQVSSAADRNGTLQKVKDTNTITIGFQEASVPFSYLDGNQKPVGYTIDICARIVDAVRQELALPDLKVAYLPVTASTRIPLLVNGTIDMNCASATNNADRQKQVAFANTHFLSANRFASKKSSGLTSIESLRGKPVGAVAGSTNLAILNRINNEKNLDMRILVAQDQLEAFMMLETDRIRALVGDDIALAVAIARSKSPADFVISSEALSKAEPYGIIIRKDDPQFKALTDRVTTALYRSPEIETIYTKWFQSPVPPSGLNFNYPLPSIMRTSFQKPSSSPDPDAYAQ